ncbi:MAG: 7-carboxy-7-deazaguanine synthase QueE [Thermoguttaceae bacterium]|jgi:7-carboxy-7-deazaguanine synthase
MRIAEIFRSVQGEGRLTGMPSIFIRASGCNLRCRFCDTPYASWEAEGEELSVQEIIARIQAWAEARHVVLTGGEPMLFAELVPLCAALHALGKHVTIETAGTRCLRVHCDLMSVSPKLSNSTPAAAAEGATRIAQHEQSRHVPEVVRRLNAEYDCQFKFVVDCLEDCLEVAAYLAALPEIDRRRVMLMPQGASPQELAEKAAWLEPYCRQQGLTFCPRRQIEWFGGRRGT